MHDLLARDCSRRVLTGVQMTSSMYKCTLDKNMRT